MRLLETLPVGFAEGRVGDRVRVIGTPAELAIVEAAGLTVVVESKPALMPGHYPTVAALEGQMADWEATWPDRVALTQLGSSVEGLALWGVRLGPQDARVVHRVVAGMHGDEGSSVALAMAMGEALLHEDPGFEGLLDHQSIWLLPLANPDGFEAGARFNRNNVDLNRNFSYLWNPDEYAPGTEPFSEPETKALRTLSLSLGATIGLSMHSGATNLGYVWNHSDTDTVDEDRLIEMGELYAQACSQEGFYLTNGADWYVTRGDLNDWAYGVQGGLDFTLEVTTTKSPDTAGLDQALLEHLPATAAWLAQPVRLKGQLVSAETDRGLQGSLAIADQTARFSTDQQGYFSRTLSSGSWALTASAPGYMDQEFTVSLEDASADQRWALTPSNLVDLRPDPVRLSQGTGDTSLTLPGVDPPDRITLSRPGLDSLNLAYDGTSYPVSSAILVPGPYTISSEDWVAPRAVFAGSYDDRVAVHSLRLEPDCLVLDGQGFAKGLQAWALWGLDRAMEPLEVLSRTENRLVLARETLPASGTVDVLLVSQGREVAVVNVLGDPELDTAAPPDSGLIRDTGEPPTGRWSRCSALPRDQAGWLVVALLLSARTRRSRRLW
jgi:hypothetical protein